jgi:hypothetical protein
MLRTNVKRPQLSDRSVRVRLLAWSYLDAAMSPTGDRGEASVDTGEAGSRPPLRNEDLWRHGSYSDLERIVDELPVSHRRTFWSEHITARDPFKSTEFKTVVMVGSFMPQSIYVPASISEAAGFLPSEAKVFSRG